MAAVQTAFDFGVPLARTPRAKAATLALVGRVNAQSYAPEAPAQASGADDRQRLEVALRAAVDIPLRLTITDNRRTMISLRKRPGVTELRLHHMFLAASEDTVRALGSYLMRSDRGAHAVLGRFIEAHRARIKAKISRPVAISTHGVHHDLSAIYDDVNARYFGGQVDARITWGREPGKARGRRRRSIKLGSYCSRERLIRVHPSLDAAFVPSFFVEYIVYHEMLHHVLPPTVRGGRRQLHDRRFKERERAFPRYADALAWERTYLDRLLLASA